MAPARVVSWVPLVRHCECKVLDEMVLRSHLAGPFLRSLYSVGRQLSTVQGCGPFQLFPLAKAGADRETVLPGNHAVYYHAWDFPIV